MCSLYIYDIQHRIKPIKVLKSILFICPEGVSWLHRVIGLSCAVTLARGDDWGVDHVTQVGEKAF